MLFYGYHGVLEEETRIGQRFIVDAALSADLKAAGQSDHLAHTINYAEVYQTCKSVVEGKPFKLIEAVAEAIAEKLLEEFSIIKSCTIKVIKPDPPIPGYYKSVAVEITRGRE